VSQDAIRTWGAIVVSVLAILTFIGALVVAFFLREPGLLNLAVGAAIANATTAVQYWMGSSAGSARKDDVIAKVSETNR
jgi:hypothetical protein